MKKVKEKKGDVSKVKLIEAAISLIAKDGDSERVSIRDIAEKAGVSSAGVLYHFQSRALLLKEVCSVVLNHKKETPIVSFLEKKRGLLATKEGQVIFISDMFSAFRDFFMCISYNDMNYCNAFRALIHSSEIKDDICLIPKFFKKDAIAFYEIYKTITGIDDLEMSHFLYTAYLDSLSARFVAQKNPDKLDSEHQFSENYDIRFFFFCRKQMLIALGLWNLSTN